VITDGRLSHLLGIAFRLRGMGFIKGAEDWVIAGSERFTVDAKAEDPATTTEQQLLVMLQNLLIERFQLKYHEESKDMPGFALIVAKNGPKLKESTSDDAGVSFGPSFKPAPGEPIDMPARKVSMTALTNLLLQIGRGPVLDKNTIVRTRRLQASLGRHSRTISTYSPARLGAKAYSKLTLRGPWSYRDHDSIEPPASPTSLLTSRAY
jgi:uncharacterized protein (TIGR03435 family)